jgi:hypothetical protein
MQALSGITKFPDSWAAGEYLLKRVGGVIGRWEAHYHTLKRALGLYEVMKSQNAGSTCNEHVRSCEETK